VPPGGGGTGNDGGGGDGGGATDGGTCTTLANTGLLVDQVGFVGDPPAGQGGVILDGTYDLNEARLYVGSGNPAPSGTTFRGSIQVTGTVVDRVTVITPLQGPATQVNERGTLSASGVNVTYATSCPSPRQYIYGYTIVGSNITLSDLVTKESFIYVRK
jgi:hypothetical protein